MSEHEVTLGEVYRAVLRVEHQAILTNGRLQKVEQRQAGDLQRLDGLDERVDKIEMRVPDEPKPKRTGLTLTLTRGSAIGIWELIKKLIERVGG